MAKFMHCERIEIIKNNANSKGLTMNIININMQRQNIRDNLSISSNMVIESEQRDENGKFTK